MLCNAPLYKYSVCGLLLATVCTLPFGAHAQQQFSRTGFGEVAPYQDDEPVLLRASAMEYDQENEVVTAKGDVEIVQGETVLLAEEVSYDQRHNVVKAHGNVSLMDVNGHVFFADDMELKDDMRAGAIRQFKARLADDSLFVATRAKRINEQVTELEHAAYSPCRVRCDDGEAREPMWQIKAEHVRIDEKEQTVTYRDAQLDAFGIPVFYSPYLSHATPGADNKSGFLTPELQGNGNLGTVVKVPYYYVMGQDRDLTVTPIFTTQEGLVMAGEYRQRFDNGTISTDGSVTRPKDRNALGFVDNGNEIRGHINARGDFTHDAQNFWGFDIRRTTDDTYLRRYKFNQDTQLTSRVYGERFGLFSEGERSYARAQALAFQGLTAQDNPDQIPLIVPQIDAAYESAPGAYHARHRFLANITSLSRDEGAKSRRLSMTGGWRLPYISPDGHIIEFDTSLRGDIYAVEDVALAGGRQYDGTTGRVIPEASVSWRYPLINRFDEGASLMFEPVITTVLSPRGGNPEEIPNEDSRVPEFTDSNLFDANRFSGYDRVETGPRLSYGVRSQLQLAGSYYLDGLIGQHWRAETDRNFPFSSELDDHLSDYVGKLGFSSEWMDIAYRFRLDQEDFTPQRNEIEANVNHDAHSLTASYLMLNNDPLLADKEEISGTATLGLSDQWQWFVSSRRDLQTNFTSSATSGLIFKNECTYLTTVIGREYTRDRDIKPSTTFLFRVALKNLE